MRSTYLDKDGPPRSSGAQSPMMDQFWRAKREAPDALLFFRMGDFYELFHEDAKIAARELGLTLTARSKGEDAIAMAGVPWRNADAYLVRLVKKGFKVAICEQMQDPREAKGLVERAVVRIMTTSACGLDFSASNLAVITPVESRIHLISMLGSTLLKASW